MKATKEAADRHNPDNDFVRHAEMLELFKGLEPYGYELDKDLKVFRQYISTVFAPFLPSVIVSVLVMVVVMVR